MSKKRMKLGEGPMKRYLPELEELNTRYHSDSVLRRKDSWHEEKTGIDKKPVPWEPGENDFLLELDEMGRLDLALEAFPVRTKRAKEVRIGQLVARRAKYKPNVNRKSRANKPWSKWDRKIVKMATTENAIANGAADPKYLAAILARPVEQVLAKLRKNGGEILLRKK